MSKALNLRTYSAVDVSRIAGVSQEIVRTWRKRGILPPLPEGEKRATFTLVELANIYLSRCLTNRAFTHKEAQPIIAAALPHVVYWVAEEAHDVKAARVMKSLKIACPTPVNVMAVDTGIPEATLTLNLHDIGARIAADAEGVPFKLLADPA